MKNALVIGSGIAGIASAIRLAVKGYQVAVLEKNTYPGGKLTTIALGAYRFDAGPSLFTLPYLVDELFALAGKDPKDYFSYSRSEVTCNYFFEDGTLLHFYADREQLLHEIHEKLQVDTVATERYLNRSKAMYDATKRTFLEKSLHKTSTYLSSATLNTLLHIPQLHLFSTMHRVNEKQLNHPKLVQIFDRYATYNGSNPYSAPGILNLIPHLEMNEGTYFPKGGMHAITTSLVRLAAELGVTFHYRQEVTEIVAEQKTVKGVQTTTAFFPAEVVICNADVKPAYRKLITAIAPPKRTMEQEPSSSAMIFYWGIKQRFDQLHLHNIFFAKDYEKEFATIFSDKTVSDDPTIYIHVSSKMEAEDVPANGENWFVMVNVPSNSGQDWEMLRTQIRKNVITKLNRLLNCDVEQLIEEEDYLDPVRIESRTGSFAGALYGASSNDRMAAFFRHPNFSNVKGLYFAGGSVHPGGGIPLCLLSAKIATDLVEN